ncbi:phosphoglycolate phosphatase [Solimicrobium silvestre]|uniref:Phosphoglycolate phosphatase n=1 Tax=Solimicrobium silvestre TaxID=2099400 RepID=A0A2S9H1W1_9BURK|nr:phosphoglycolate phosphatase [Solimicrobium silvestre]PRC93940.1 Phosphoglycolate phosphatase, bacterial [Solimicrobium silvestre]
MIKMNGIQAAIIDLDGTMIDTIGDFLVAINAMRAEFALAPLEQAVIQNMVGKGSENLIRQVLAVDFSPAEVERHFDAAMNSYQRNYLSINGQYSKLYPDVQEGLSALQAQGIRLACVTNKPISFALPLLKQKSLHHYFDVIYGGDCLPHKKPHPAPLLQVCSDFKLEPNQVVAIGDSSNDAIAARAAGCWALTVPYGYNHGEAVQAIDTDGIVETLLCAAHFVNS